MVTEHTIIAQPKYIINLLTTCWTKKTDNHKWCNTNIYVQILAFFKNNFELKKDNNLKGIIAPSSLVDIKSGKDSLNG